MNIRIATTEDLAVISRHDHHISPAELENSIRLGRVALAEENGEFLGWLRWNLFWDNTPFLNLVYLLEPHRGKGRGKAMMAWWESRMAELGFDRVMTSTASDEYAQHFYVNLGYTAVGGFTPFGESYELIFGKKL
ncbi:MAG: GNAT family N-acetyltransferase [Clostridia bacterium]|nr:GNAT family N-acetyltransferase [Clostridia bacterium]